MSVRHLTEREAISANVHYMYKGVLGVDKIMETLRNWGIQFVCVGYIKSTSVGNTECSSVCLHSVVLVQCISDCVEWQSVWKIRKIGELSDFERGLIVGARLAGVSVIKTVTLLGACRGTVSKVMPAYTNHGKTTSAKRNCERKSALTEGDRRKLRIVSKNHRTPAARVIYPSWPKYCKVVRGQVGQSGAPHDRDVISEQWCTFPRRQCHHSHSWNCPVMVSRAGLWTSASSLASIITIFEHRWVTLISFQD
jgi:hypothetical protein